MSFSSWLRNWNRPAVAPRRPASRTARRPTGYRPRLETLEDRALMAGLPYPTAATVDQLVADINYADNTGGAFTIELQTGTTFALTNGLPPIGGSKLVDLTIHGNGGTLERTGSNSFNFFNVASGASLTLDQMTLTGGYLVRSCGGAIFNQGTLTISNSTVSSNTASIGNGGGICNAGGTVTITNSTLADNYAEGGNGGGIYNAGGMVTISDNSSLAHNWASVVDYVGGGHGGGIYNDATGTVIVRNTSQVWGNLIDWYDQGLLGDDVENSGVVYLETTSAIGVLYGNPAILIDPNAPQLRISDVAVPEGNAGTTAAQFTVTLSTPSTDTVTVAYATADSSATAGSDYQAASGTLTFAPGETSKTIAVLVNGDRLGESNETWRVNLSGATNAFLADVQGVGTIVDDEPHISIDDVAKQEGRRGQTTQFVFTVTLSAAYDQSVTMSFKTTAGTAKSGDDYVAKTGTLTFAPGETTKTITITVNGDNKKEADETFYLDLLKNSSNSWFNNSRGVGTILNDD